MSECAMRILAIDIETRPNLAYVWDLWGEQHIGLKQLVKHQQMLCWVAKWIGESDSAQFRSVYHDGQDDMILGAWYLLDQADVVLHYNGRRFDVPHLNREFLRLGLDPPSPYKQIDLMQVVKREFKFSSNKLDHVAQQLGLEGKVSHKGFDLWLECMAGNEQSWAEMREYNMRDVELLDELYMKLRPWIRSHPSHGAMEGADVCPGCGGHKLQPRGWAYTQTAKYRRYRCGDCGRWSRSSKRESHTQIVQVPNS